MRTALGAVLLALTTAVGGLVALPGPAARADGVTRIMLAGDSITQGFDGDFTWRYRLYQELTRQQVPVDFVGPRSEPYGGRSTYLAKGWDTDHDAKGGTTLNAQMGLIDDDMSAYQPDVLVALYGTNDLRNGATPDQLIDRWRTYVARARAVRPDVKIVIGEVYSVHAPQRDASNALLQSLAAELDTEESPVVVAHLDAPDFSRSRDTYGGTHPTPTGEIRIAALVTQALHALGVVPEQPVVTQRYVPWTPPMRASVRRAGHRLTIDWLAAKRRYRAHEARVRWTDLRTGRSTTTRWRGLPAHVTTPPLHAGRWQVQVQGRRHDMRSVWGPGVVRRIPRG
jgi:lysophospholipase L1-like esterase